MARPPAPYWAATVSFGFKGRYIINEDGYLEWILETFSETSLVWKAATDALARRDSLLSDLKSCTRKRDLQEGKRVHINAVESGNGSNIFIAAALINMYAKCGSMVDARRVFGSLDEPDVVSWTALISGYADNGEGQVALEFFSRMKDEQVCTPNSVTYLAAIKACTSMAGNGDEAGKGQCLKRGREIHLEIGQRMDYFVQSALTNMYAKCSSMVEAQFVFDSIVNPNVVCWTAMILGYADNGEGRTALELYSRMKSAHGCTPNSMTYVAVIKACTSLSENEAGTDEWLKLGREIHSEIGKHLNYFVQNALLNMYAKFGSMADARRVFVTIAKPNAVSWTALIMGYADNGESQVALDSFFRMKSVPGCAPDSMTYVAALKACGSVGALAIGRKLHSEISDFDVHLVTCLVDFYAKCGSMVEAREVFDSHSRARNIATWHALLAGYGRFGDNFPVFNLFEVMQEQGFRPETVTFVCLLLCCSHAGMVEKARELLQAMPVKYEVNPTVMHYNCMVDVLGRANQLDEAVALLQKMPCNPNAVTWMTLLGACRKWKNVEIGRMAFQSLGDLGKKDDAACALMAQIYGSRGMWEEQESMLETRRNSGRWKLLDQANVIDELGRTMKFVVGEEDPPEVKDKLKQFLKDIRQHGYVSESCRNVATDGEKEEALCSHSERRAVVYGILKTPLGEPVRAFKNMRTCDDCHWAIKIFSKLSRRVIIFRDENRFHVMENGNCSCAEYW